MDSSAKRYDAAYYRRFYRDPRSRVLEPVERRLRVAVAVATAERWLGRSIRSVVDVGCGLGLWGREIARLRPGARYLGFDPSPALPAGRRGRVVLEPGSFAELAALPARSRFDLVLCVDVLHYLTRSEVDEGLAILARRAQGALVLEVLTSAEPIEGDLDGLMRRSPAWWQERFARHGLVGVGQQIYLPSVLADHPAELDKVALLSGRRIVRP